MDGNLHYPLRSLLAQARPTHFVNQSRRLILMGRIHKVWESGGEHEESKEKSWIDLMEVVRW